MAYRSDAVANKFIELAKSEGAQLTPMQLIKLTYIAHGWSLAINDEPLISDPVQAWMYGPVIPYLYRTLKSYGSKKVSQPIGDETVLLEKQAAQLVETVYKKYGSLTAAQLSNLTHRRGTPWQQVYNDEERYIDIPDTLIKRHYQDLLAQR